jgi:hypothetical protein
MSGNIMPQSSGNFSVIIPDQSKNGAFSQIGVNVAIEPGQHPPGNIAFFKQPIIRLFAPSFFMIAGDNHLNAFIFILGMIIAFSTQASSYQGG